MALAGIVPERASASTSIKSGSRTSHARTKVEDPSRVYADPTEVVTDPSLSAHQKRVVLNSLEQDARQLAIASAEGMSGGGGEETNPRNILI